jgi:hypothetical protein
MNEPGMRNATLGPLRDNDGPTQTHLPLAGSPAIDAGNNTYLAESALGVDFNGDGDTDDALNSDQRGFARIDNSTVDIGAVETSSGAITYAINIDPTSIVEGTSSDTYTATVTITRSGSISTTSSVDVGLQSAATQGEDYSFAFAGNAGASFDGTTLSFDATTTTAAFTLVVQGDDMPEPDETIIIALSNATAPQAAILAPATASLTIVSDDATRRIYIPAIER